jgi:hypothetical protein
MLAKEPQVKFKMLLSEIERASYKFQPAYEVEWPKPSTPKREYFTTIIENELVSYLNDYYGEMRLATNEKERLCLINRHLQPIKSFLEDLFLLFFSMRESDDIQYVLEYLKHQLIRLYLEVISEDRNQADQTDLEDLYETFFMQAAPIPAFIHNATPIETAVAMEEPKATYSLSEFEPIMGDFREEVKGILSYDTIIKNPKRFANFEKDLYLQGFIDQDYNFTHKHGLKNELAAIYHELISREYFSPRDFEKLKEIKPIHVRKFLDHRYQVNLDKQFRVIFYQS